LPITEAIQGDRHPLTPTSDNQDPKNAFSSQRANTAIAGDTHPPHPIPSILLAQSLSFKAVFGLVATRSP